MSDPRGLDYLLIVDDEAVPLAAGMTLGRHLDNDLIVAGEDVRDFHLRVDVSQRGPTAVPLGDAVLHHNGVLVELPTGLMPGDRLELGQTLIELRARALDPAEADSWRLTPASNGRGVAVTEVVRVGREPGSDLLLGDLHASRRHALVCNVDGSIWVKDLESANGTFINGERIRGARRAFHGDEIRFDHFVCRLIGSGGELTSARPATPRDRAPYRPQSLDDGGPSSGQTLEFKAVTASQPVRPPAQADMPAGMYLAAWDGVGTPDWQRLPVGRTLIGRAADCDLQLHDLTVSGHHAELVVRPGSATVTDLMSTNGTFCDGRRIQSLRLADGSCLSMGRVEFLYREIAPAAASRPLYWAAGLAGVLALGAALLLAL